MIGVLDKLALQARKEMWLKAIIQSIPTHVRRFFQLHVGTCDDMRRSIANHWWGMENGKKNLHKHSRKW
jgi:hypothetical protein